MSATKELQQSNSAAGTTNGRAVASGSSETLSQRYSGPKFWRDVLPAGTRKKILQNVSAWTDHVARRTTPAPVSAACEADGSPLHWGIDLHLLSAEANDMVFAADLLDRATQSSTQRKSSPSPKSAAQINALLAEWKNGNPLAEPTVSRGLTALAVAHVLATGANQIDPNLWWQSLDALWQSVQLYDSWQLDCEYAADDALAQQLLAAELPLTLSYLFPEIKPVHGLKSGARERLSEAIGELLNGEGLAHGRFRTVIPALLACWTRCRSMAAASNKACWSKAAEQQLGWLVRQSLRWSSADGRFLQSGDAGVKWSPEFLRASLNRGGDESDFAAASSLLGKLAPARSKKAAKFCEPEPSDHCEWAGQAVLRTGWTRDAAVAAVEYSDREVHLDVAMGRTPIFRGVWRAETTFDGQELLPVGSWEEICWFSDEDVDYLELSIDLEGGAQLDRQIVLARDERFLFLADYVKTVKAGEQRHAWSLPLANGLRFEGAEETREGLLLTTKPIARAMPLALPEWRCSGHGGELESEGRNLTLGQTQSGAALACPLLIDLDSRRVGKPCTWRQLTVAESLEIQPPDVAVGYRAQCAKRQWLFYRSLAQRANRTLLGQNTSSDCLIGRFLAPEGGIEELVEIEG